MIKTILAFIFLVLAVASTAADEAQLSAPSWSRYYLGVNAGYGFGTNISTSYNQWTSNSSGIIQREKYFDSLPLLSGDIYGTQHDGTQSGFMGGAQLGRNFQINSNIVVGGEADIQGTLINSSQLVYRAFASDAYGFTRNNYGGGARVLINQNGFDASSVSAGIDYLGTVRGRVGYLVNPSLLVYCSAGLAYGGVWAKAQTTGYSSNSIAVLGAIDPLVNQVYLGGGNTSKLLTGYTAGGGFEWIIGDNWSLKTEALYWNLGSVGMTTSSLGLPTVGPAAADDIFSWQAYANPGFVGNSIRVNYQGITARTGVNYHFNLSVPPVNDRM